MEDFEVETMKEYIAVFTSLKKNQPKEVLKRFYQRHDHLIAKVIDYSGTPIACKKSCFYCCYYKVEAKPVEIFLIVEFVKQTFETEIIGGILEQAKRNVEEAAKLSYVQHLTTNQKCPFLVSEGCSIYEVRPMKCRNFHATEVELCIKSYENPTDLSIPNSYNELLHLITNTSTKGFEQALETAGFDSITYDLNSAVIEAFQNKKLSKRFNKGKRAFIKAVKVKSAS
jgi:Fe-S-cluster containining protein